MGLLTLGYAEVSEVADAVDYFPGGMKQQAAAGDNVTLWVVDRASHGEYRAVAPDEYEVRVVGFFNRALNAKK
ncbi:MAG: hypothetical protein KDI79_17115 [Anaerolineae bacterium]|nr:hypothetical protein [Anaerolineae bacterium]